MDPTAKPRAFTQPAAQDESCQTRKDLQDRDPSAKSMHLWSINPHQTSQVHTLGEGQPLYLINGIEKPIGVYETLTTLHSLDVD